MAKESFMHGPLHLSASVDPIQIFFCCISEYVLHRGAVFSDGMTANVDVFKAAEGHH